MSALQRRKTYGPPVLGLNTRFESGTLQDLEAVTLTNYQVNETGSMAKYAGYTLDASPFSANTDSFIRSIYNFRRGSTVNQLLVAAQDDGNANATYKVDVKFTIGDGNYTYLTYGIGTATFTHNNTAVAGTNTSWTHELKSGDKIKLASDPDADYTEIASVNSDTSLTLVGGGYLGTTAGSASPYLARKIWNKANIIAMTTFNNVAILIDGNGIPQQYDATNIFGLINSYSGTVITVQPNAAPVANYIEVHKNRVFMADQTGNLFWSHAFDQTFWDPASTEAISPQDGGTVVGIKSFADSLYVFKNNGFVYRVFGNFDDSAIGTVAYIQRVPYSEKIGLIANRSIVVHGNYLYFIAQTGIYTIDFRGYMQKISYIIDPTTQTLTFTVSGNVSKLYPYTTTAQWNTGTHAGTYSTSANQLLSTFFDDYRITDASQAYNTYSIAIDNRNGLHVAYVSKTAPTQITYVRYLPNGTGLGGTQIRTETSILTDTTHGNVLGLSIAVSNNDYTVGIAYWGDNNKGLYYTERTPDTQSPFAYGTWDNTSNDQVQGARNPTTMSLIFSGGGVPYIASTASGPTNDHVVFYTRAAGVWSIVDGLDTGSLSSSSAEFHKSAIALDNSNNLYIAVQLFGTSHIFTYKSTNGGSTWTSLDNYTASSGNFDPRATLSVGFNHAGHFISVCSDTGGNIIKRDHTAASTTTINTTSGQIVGGWFPVYNTLDNINLDTDNYYVVQGTAPNQDESFTSNLNTGGGIGSTVTNPTLNVIYNAGNLKHPSMQSLQTANGSTPGQVVAFIQAGINANELVIRRCCFYGYWQGPETNDSTLSSWGTFLVSGVGGGANYTFETALSSVHPATNFTTITNGAVISSNASLIYIIPRVEFTLTGWNGSTITSLILNYFGAGVDAKQIYGISFFNEVYFAGCPMGQSNNNQVIIQDIKNAFITTTYPINCMEVFNGQLYAGSSLQGDVYILKNGYTAKGAAYTSTYVSKEDFLDFIELEKDFFTVYILYRLPNGGSFTFSYRIDNYITGNGAWTTLNIVPNSSGIFEVPIHSQGGTTGSRGRSIQFMVQDTATNQQSEILGFVLVYGLLNIRG